jgi:hypothetical protein
MVFSTSMYGPFEFIHVDVVVQDVGKVGCVSWGDCAQEGSHGVHVGVHVLIFFP